jgi:Protein of unknown function (DUF3347)
MKTVKITLLFLVFFSTFSTIKAQEINVNKDANYVITSYLGVKNALVAGDSRDAKAKAKKLLAAILLVPVNKFSADQRKVWAAFTDKLQFDSRHISESDAIDHQREHFASLSKNMYELVKGLKLNDVALYEQYCPMKKATWLSETALIKNPYYGSKMLTCGKTTATLEAVIN